jgi:hypothetical protein
MEIQDDLAECIQDCRPKTRLAHIVLEQTLYKESLKIGKEHKLSLR